MALHCPATLVLVEEGAQVGVPDAPAAQYGPWTDEVDVVAELQHLADLHRGERVVVTVAAGGLEEVLGSLGLRVRSDGAGGRLRVEVGDDGWVVVPWDAGAAG